MRAQLVIVSVTALAVACGSDNPDPTGTFDLTCNLPEDALVFGGVARDGIPALSFPNFIPGRDANFLDDDERVLGLVVDGQARAYPLAILWWHEVVNDFIGDVPVLITYCPLTGSGIAFEPRVGQEFRNFGVSGILFENNLVMFDRTSETLYNQMLLGGICGPDRGAVLPRIPIIETTWGFWRTSYPNTTVVDTDTGFSQPYGIYPYGNYAQLNNPTTLFPSSEWRQDRPPKELVLGVERGSSTMAYPFGVLEDMGETLALNETLEDLAYLVTYRGRDHTAIAFDRVVDGQELTFTVSDSVRVFFEDAETGSVWNRRGEATEGPLAGSQLTQLAEPYAVYWFAWSIFHPETDLLTEPTT